VPEGVVYMCVNEGEMALHILHGLEYAIEAERKETMINGRFCAFCSTNYSNSFNPNTEIKRKFCLIGSSGVNNERSLSEKKKK